MGFSVPYVSTLSLNNASLDDALHAVHENRTLSVGVAAGVALVLVVRYLTSPWRKLPPGPSGLPIIGNALQLVDKQWLKFSAWRKIYGKLIPSKHNRC